MITLLFRYIKFNIYLFVSILTYSLTAQAFEISSQWRPVMTLGTGTATSSVVGQSQTFPIINPETDSYYDYSAYRPNQTSAAYRAFLGAEWQINSVWLIQAGVGYNGNAAYSAKGQLMQGPDIESADAFNYSYNVLVRQLMLQSKLLYTIRDHYHPYGTVAVGSAFNRAYNFQTNIPFQLTFTREYNDSTIVSFAYEVGAGVDVDITDNLRLGVGYRFADQGSTSFSQASISNVNVAGTISQTHIYSNLALVELSWRLS